MNNRYSYWFVCTFLLFINFISNGQDLKISQGSNEDSQSEQRDTLPSSPSANYTISKTNLDCEVKRRADSSVYDAKSKLVKLYGNAVIEYCSLKIEANEIHYNTESGDAEAFAVVDSLGRVEEYALFSDGNQEMQYEYLRYNFKSERGNVKQIVTKQGEGVVWGKKVKQIGPEEFYVQHTRYSSCNLEHPHYYFTFEKSKIKNEKFAAGKNLSLYIKDIPTPIYFPFAIFPLERGKRAGFTRPRVAYDRERGFGLQSLGWYQPINDNMDFTAIGDFYTSGSWNFNTQYRYERKYKYRMNLNFGYSTVQGFEVSDALGVDLKNSFQFRYTFAQDPKVWKNSNLNASISLGQRNFKQINITDPSDRLNNTYTSSVSFNTKFPNSPFSFSSNLRYNQNTQSKRVSMSLPDATLSMSTIYPLKKLSKSSKNNLFNTINLSYRSNFKNNLEQADSIFFEKPIASLTDATFGAQHAIPLSASFKIAKFFTLSPSINYNEVWTNKNRLYSWDDSTKTVSHQSIDQFRTTRWFNSSVGLITRIYGMRQFNKGKLAAIRHVMSPSISMGYTPDFSNATSAGDPIFYSVQVDSLGNERIYSLFEGTPFGGPPQRSGGSIGFNLGNNIEMKVRSDKDTSGMKKIKIFENLNLSTNYNLKADSLNLSPISVSGNTKLFNRVNMNINGSFNPYAISPVTGKRVNTFYFKENKGPVDFVNGAFRLSGSVNPKSKNEKQVTEVNLIPNPLYPQEQLFADNYMNSYIDFSVPWDLRLGYQLSYRKSYGTEAKKNISVTNAITAQGKLNLTDEWRIQYNTGYDFRNNEINYTQIRINRDLHCWQMGLSWQPIGSFKSYNFSISPKSSLLSGLKVQKRRTILDNFNHD